MYPSTRIRETVCRLIPPVTLIPAQSNTACITALTLSFEQPAFTRSQIKFWVCVVYTPLCSRLKVDFFFNASLSDSNFSLSLQNLEQDFFKIFLQCSNSFMVNLVSVFSPFQTRSQFHPQSTIVFLKSHKRFHRIE
jgi:hypothetical protein